MLANLKDYAAWIPTTFAILPSPPSKLDLAKQYASEVRERRGMKVVRTQWPLQG